MREYIKKYSEQFGIPEGLICAIIQVESSQNPYAIRYEPNYKYLHQPEHYSKKHLVSFDTEVNAQKTSWGPMQVMGGTARWLGFDKSYLSQLLEPEFGLYYGAMYLKKQYDKYQDWTAAIVAYNAGSAQKIDGVYANQSYVDKVLQNWR